MKLPESKRPKIEATIQDNGLISILNGSLKGVKKELSNGYIKASEMLPYAAITKNWEVVELLLKYNNIDINGTFDGQSLMSFAITYLYSDVVEFLLDHGACIPNRITPIRFNENDDYYGFGTTFTPIVWAVKNKKEPLVDVLIKNGVDVTDGEALLYSFHAPSIRNKLVAAGANINTIAEYYDESF